MNYRQGARRDCLTEEKTTVVWLHSFNQTVNLPQLAERKCTTNTQAENGLTMVFLSGLFKR